MEREYYCKSNDDQQSLSPACPRCGSLNTKFCYYNNYSLTQPRYFCKGCRRYWTKGGSLRNVPIGGGCRKSRRGRTTTINNNRVVSTDGGGGGILQHTTTNSVSSDDRHNHGSTSIDLAAVYANFLNHHQQSPPRPRQPENINQINLPPLPDGILIPSIVEFSGFHQEINNGFFECGSSSSFTDNPRLLMPESSNTNTPPLLGGGSSNMFFQGLFQKHAGNSSFNDGGIILPPLPGEDVVAVADSRGMLWPDSDVILPDQIFPPATNNETAGAAVGGNLSPRFSDGLNNLEAIFRT